MGSSFKRYIGIFRRVARTCEGSREGDNDLFTQEMVRENSYIRFEISIAKFEGATPPRDTTP